MSVYNVSVSHVLVPTPPVKEWLHIQLKASKALIKDALQRVKLHETSLFGRPISFLEKAVPESAGISSYVSYGMGCITAARLASQFPNGFRYRSTTKGAVQQFENGDFYASGVPGRVLHVKVPTMLLPNYDIVSIQFDYNEATDHWMLTTNQNTLPPRPRRKK